ncbi:MAG TPA: hypothetical protein VEX86_03590 [Longimicrobium sp.]|nr:hypothetical protein [Longimicrobium sp.]
MTYMITCVVDPHREAARAALRAGHLQYVGSRRPEISFGGVVEAPDGSLQRVVLFVEAGTERDAWAFVLGDPYAALYETITVTAFQARIPAPGGPPPPS